MVDVLLCVLCLACVAAICAVDVAQRRIPNKLVAALVVLRVVGAVGFLAGVASQLWSPGRLVEQLVAAAALAVALYAFGALMTRLEGRRALGFGDVKLAFALGLWTVPHSLLLFSCLAASLALACALVQMTAERLRGTKRIAELGPAVGSGPFGGEPGTFPFAPSLGVAFVVVMALQATVLPL